MIEYRSFSISAVWACLCACGATTSEAPPEPPTASVEPAVASAGDDSTGDDSTGSEVARAVTIDAGAPSGASPAAPDAAPAQLVPDKKWPFYVWDSARAYSYNQRPYGPGVSLLVYDQRRGWNSSISDERPITRAQASVALELLSRTKGEMEVSKCAFPRHAIVLFSGAAPVASINVCFECGDILIWPPYDPSPDWPERKSKMYGKLMKAYDRTFPRWKQLFGDELGFATEWKKGPSLKLGPD